MSIFKIFNNMYSFFASHPRLSFSTNTMAYRTVQNGVFGKGAYATFAPPVIMPGHCNKCNKKPRRKFFRRKIVLFPECHRCNEVFCSKCISVITDM